MHRLDSRWVSAIKERSEVTVARHLLPFAGVGMPSRSGATQLIVLILLTGCAAQEERAPEVVAPAESQVESQVESHLYPAELVLDHQAAIGLTEAQRAAIRAELQRSQAALVDAEIELRAHREALAGIVAAPRVDEERAMEAAARVAGGERAIKLDHLRLLLRIKNHLTEDQQQILDRARAPSPTAPRGARRSASGDVVTGTRQSP